MMDFEHKVSRLEVEVSALKEKVSFFSVIFEKFDKTLESLKEMIEERRNDTNKDLKDVYTKIDSVEIKIMEEMHRLRTEMKLHHEEEKKKFEELNKWRWIVVGAAMVVGWIISKVFGG